MQGLFKVLDKYSHFPANKLLAVQLLSTHGLEHKMTQEQIADECKITRETLWMWRGEKEFNDALVEVSRELSRPMLPAVFTRLSKSIDTASDRDLTNMARLLFQVHGEITEKKEITSKNENYNIDTILAGLDELE